jgi:hypothetical protein
MIAGVQSGMGLGHELHEAHRALRRDRIARPPLSIQITARIQFEGIANLCDASVMNAAKGERVDELVGGAVIVGSALAEPMA